MVYYVACKQTNVYKYTMEGTDMQAKEEIKKPIEEMTEQELDREIGERARLLTEEEKVKLMCILLKLAASE